MRLEATMLDELTGTYTRPELDRQTAEAQSHGRSVPILYVDVDRLKRFNQHNGYVAGDEILKALAAKLIDTGAIVVRVRGGSFCLLFPGASLGDARVIGDEIVAWARDALTPAQVRHCGDRNCCGPVRLTLSVLIRLSQVDETGFMSLQAFEEDFDKSRDLRRDTSTVIA